MIKSRKGFIAISILIKWIIVALLLFVAIDGLLGFKVTQKLEIFLPSFQKEATGVTTYSDKCPVHVAAISDNFIYFCKNNACSDKSKLFISNEKVVVSRLLRNKQVGEIAEGKVYIYNGILNQFDDLQSQTRYSDVKENLPPHQDILNLHESYFYKDDKGQIGLCRGAP
jgi:hypothetical protein